MKKQQSLFNHETPPESQDGVDWQSEWQGMPEFVQDKQRPYAKIIVRFRNQADLDEFARRIGQKLNPNSQCTWFPELVRNTSTRIVYTDES